MRQTALLAMLAAGIGSAASLQSDIEYCKAGDVSLKMDAWIPDGRGPFPTVIVVHGGGWQNGDKQKNYKPFFEPLSEAGFAWFTVNYRLAPEYRYPAAVDDVLQAIRYVEKHAKEYKVDLKRIAITGESAGGHIVSLIGARYGHDLHLAAVVPFYPVNDFEAVVTGADKTPGAVKAISAFLGFTDVNETATRLMREGSPVTYVKKGMPPYLFVHGTADPLVKIHQSEAMCAQMKQAGSRCEIYAVEGASHGMVGWEKNPAWQGYKQKVPEWLHQTMGR
jgi:acetyl esterase/lipase